MQRYKLARWKLILRRGRYHRKLLKPIWRLRRSRSRVARICSSVILTLAWLVLPLLPGCERRVEDPRTTPVPPGAAPDSSPTQGSPVAPQPVTGSGPSIKVRGLDNEYRGNTRVLPNKQLIHRKETQ